MLLFKQELVDLIIRGIKTETRRAWKKQLVKEGSIHKARTNFNSNSTFAILHILYVKKQKLKDISDEDARKEGFSSLEEFKDTWIKCYKKFNPEEEVYVIGFRAEPLNVNY